MKPRYAFAVLTGWVLLATAGVAQSIGDEPREIKFNHAKIGSIELNAITTINWKEHEPFIQNISCFGTSPNFSLSMNRFGEMSFSFSGDGPRNADETPSYQYNTLNIRWLKVDGVTYETKAVSIDYPRDRLSDFSYKPESGDGDQLASFRGYLAVRRDPKSPWVMLTSLVPQIMTARSVSLGVGTHGRPDEAAKIVVKADVAALRDALKWCEDAVNSEAAYRLKAG